MNGDGTIKTGFCSQGYESNPLVSPFPPRTGKQPQKSSVLCTIVVEYSVYEEKRVIMGPSLWDGPFSHHSAVRRFFNRQCYQPIQENTRTGSGESPAPESLPLRGTTWRITIAFRPN